MRRRSDAAALRCAQGSLRCSIAWPVAKLASLPAVVALKHSRRVRGRCALTRAATRSALLGAASVAAGAHPPTALPAPPWHGSMHAASIAARWAVPGGGDLWGGEHRSSALGARHARASTSDSRRLSERSERSEFRRASVLREAQRSRCAASTATVGAPAGYRPPRRPVSERTSFMRGSIVDTTAGSAHRR